MKKWIEIGALNGAIIQLLPLEISHGTALLEAASDGRLWDLWYTSVPSSKTIDAYITTALEEKNAGNSYPFVVWHKQKQQIIGSTRFYNLQPQHRRLEIGYTWYAETYHRTVVNTECKYLLLEHAFESLQCIAVQFLTDWHNLRSRKAILRLGAKQDGVLRHHRLNADGSYRDSVVFSITDQEWLSVKKSLTYKLSR